MVLVVVTRRRHPDELMVVEHAEVAAEHPTLRTVVRNRYVMLIVGFQMLSAVESQWLDYLVFARAANRYPNGDELAAFVSRFSAIAYGTDILFLLVLAGFLLHRFGLRYGLVANAFAVLGVLVAILVTGVVGGSSTSIVFFLIVAARVTDLTMSDGSSRTSLSAAYQAVPSRLRPFAQATVEGLAVPVAIGVSGVALLVIQSVGGADGLMLPLMTSVVVVFWAIVATLLYREYRVNLLASLRGRTLRPVDLTLEGESSLIAIDRLVDSRDERDVRLGLDILTMAAHPELPTRLQRLTIDDRVDVRTDALERLVDIDPDAAAIAARDGIDDASPRVRAACIRVLGAAGSAADLPRIVGHEDDADPEVQIAAVFALSRIGDDVVRAEVAAEVGKLARSEKATDRTLAARMLGEHRAGDRIARAGLGGLLVDHDADVVNATLAALHFPDDGELLELVADHLGNRRTVGAAADAMIRAGDAALVVVDDALSANRLRSDTLESLVRVARTIAGPTAFAVLWRHVGHHDREVGLAVMRSLATLGPSDANDVDLDRVETVVLGDDLEHATRVLHARVAFADEFAARMLNAALQDELVLLRQRVLAALSMRHGTDGLSRVVFQLEQRDTRSHALALEWLDVSLAGPDRAVIALLDPGLSDRERVSALSRWYPVAPSTHRDLLLDLVQDREDRWRRPWITACALYAASEMSSFDIEAAAVQRTKPVAGDEDGIVQETLAGLLRRRG
jgi:HEAT repeat protein